MIDFNGVTRKTRGSYRVLYSEPRPIVVRLAPGDLLEFREHGRRQTWSLPVDLAFKLAVRRQAGR